MNLLKAEVRRLTSFLVFEWELAYNIGESITISMQICGCCACKTQGKYAASVGIGNKTDERDDNFMASKIIDVKISEDLIPYLYTIKDGKTVGDKVTLSVVIGLFLTKTVTLEKAAELSGKSIWDFMDILKEQKIPWGEYSEDDFQLDNLALNNLSEGYYE